MSSEEQSSFLSYILTGTAVAGSVAAALLVVLYVNQNKLLYMPNPPGFPVTPDDNPPGWRSPLDWNADGRMKRGQEKSDFFFEDTFIETFDGCKIHVWLIAHKHGASTVPTVIYFHGNAGNMGFRLKNAMLMFSESGVNVLMMDYRGYGKSTGVPTERGLNIDGDAVLEYASQHPVLKGSPIVCFGRSLGGALSISLAHRWPSLVRAVVVENTFLSIAAMVDKLMPAVSFMKDLVLAIDWGSDKKISTLEQPVLFISGDSDELVPTQHMMSLHRLALKSRLREFFSVRGGTHNDTWERAGVAYYQKLREFLGKSFPECYGNDEKCVVQDSSSEDRPSPGSGSQNTDDEFYKITAEDMSPQPKVSIPTMGENFKVSS